VTHPGGPYGTRCDAACTDFGLVDAWRTLRVSAALLALLLLLSSCASVSPQPSVGASNAGSPWPTATQTAEPTPSPTPEPAGRLEKVRELVIAWQATTIFIGFQVVVEVKNTGTDWVRLEPLQSSYEVLDANGGVTTSGTFPYAFPEYVAPGATGYLVEDSMTLGDDVARFTSVRTNDRYGPATAGAFPTFEVGGLGWHAGHNGGLTAGGSLAVAPPGADVGNAAVGVLCLGADGIPLGLTTTYLVQNLTAGEPKDFRTVTESPPLTAKRCATTVGYAQDTGT
jgi:hypothetical protein